MKPRLVHILRTTGAALSVLAAAALLAMNSAGAITADYYGETYCDGVWQWHYAHGQSQPLTVTGNILGLPYAVKEPDR